MPDEAQEHPRVVKVITNWLGGITAVLVALVGVKAAYTQLFPSPTLNEAAPTNVTVPITNTTIPTNEATNTVADHQTTNEVGPAPAPPANPLPLRYSKPNGVLEWRHGFWVETDTRNGMELPFKQISRKNGEITAYDESRDLYLKWPDEGGMVQWSNSNPVVWKNLYMAEPEDAPNG